jgi:hypothetical protein
MGLHKVLEELIKKKRFWMDFFFITRTSKDEGYTELENGLVELYLGDGYSVTVGLDIHLTYFPLKFTSENAWGTQIAHDDQAHWRPYALRWEELELICKAVAAEDPEIPHPGPALLFLYRFAPICEGDDVDHIVSMLTEAWKRLDLFSDAEIRRLIERADYRGAGFRWHYDADNDFWWIAKGDNPDTAESVYTSRYRGSAPDDFPSKQWNVLLEKARSVVSEAEHEPEDSSLDDSAQHNEEDSESKLAAYEPREHYCFEISIDLQDPERPIKGNSIRYFYVAMDNALRVLDMGSSNSRGCINTTINGESVTINESISVSIYGDLERGISFIKQMFWWYRVPLQTKMTQSYKPFEFDTVDIGNYQPSGPDLYLGISKPDELPRCSWLVSHTLPDDCEAQLWAAAKDAKVEKSKARDGWLSVVASDGGELGFNFSRLDSESIEGSGLIALRNIRPGVSTILHKFMTESGMALLPVAIMAVPIPEEFEYGWPRHRVIKSAERLHEILVRGAYEWGMRSLEDHKKEIEDD